MALTSYQNPEFHLPNHWDSNVVLPRPTPSLVLLLDALALCGLLKMFVVFQITPLSPILPPV